MSKRVVYIRKIHVIADLQGVETEILPLEIAKKVRDLDG